MNRAATVGTGEGGRPWHFVEQVLDRSRPADQVVLSDQTRALTAAGLRAEVYGFARVLHSLDLGRASTVALLAPNTCSAVTLRYAANLIGCTTVYAPDDGNPAHLTAFLAEVGADHLVVLAGKEQAGDQAERLQPGLRLLGAGLPAPEPGAGPVDVEVLARSGDFEATAFRSLAQPDDPACLVTSGGTTGQPKASIRSYSQWAAMVAGPADPLRRQLICTPLAHVAQVQLDQTLLGGGTVVLWPARRDFDPVEVLDVVEAERITHLCLVEPALAQLCYHPDLSHRDLSSVVAISHIGADASAALRRQLLQQLRVAGAGGVLQHTYGSSEVGLVSVLAPAEYATGLPEVIGTAGRPLPGVQVHLKSIHTGVGSTADSALGGPIVVASPAVCQATTRYPDPATDPDHRATCTRATGDWGILGSDGRLTVRGRIADRRRRGRFLTFPVDIQEALCSHPGVGYAVAVPTHDHDQGTGFLALVVPRPDDAVTTVSALVEHVARQQDGLLPLDGLSIAEAVPTTEQGKPDRNAVRALVTSRLRRPQIEDAPAPAGARTDP